MKIEHQIEFDKIKEDILSEYPRMKKNGKFEIPLPELDRLKETYNIVTIQKQPPNYLLYSIHLSEPLNFTFTFVRHPSGIDFNDL